MVNWRVVKITTLTVVIFYSVTYVMCLAGLYADRQAALHFERGFTLPDVMLDNIPKQKYNSNIPIFLAILSFFSAGFIRHHMTRMIRKLMLIETMLYGLRAITVFVTTLPSSEGLNCIPRANPNWLTDPFFMFFQYKVRACADMVFSGHICLIMSLALVVCDDFKSEKRKALRVASRAWMWTLVAAELGVLLTLHYHYSVDIVLAAYITMVTWGQYHRYMPHPRFGWLRWLAMEDMPKSESLLEGQKKQPSITMAVQNSQSFST